MLQVLNEKGEIASDPPTLAVARMLEILRYMIRARTLDRKLAKMTLQGRIASYHKIEGQEAHVAAALAMTTHDWLYPAYREMGMWLVRGLPMESVVRRIRGAKEGRWDADALRISLLCATIGTQLPHAVGHAYAARLLGRKDEAVLTVLGDGATSTPDFHAALNFAGVWRAPVVFLCQNNQWAEETPVHKQTASRTIAEKAHAYGFPGLRVDGQDALAVYKATEEALERARSGGGPTLIEMLTYRYSPHSVSAHDPRPEQEKRYWYERDPVTRLASYLTARGSLNATQLEQIEAAAAAEVEDAVERVEQAIAAEGEPTPEFMIHNVYERVPSVLSDQLDEWQRYSGLAATKLDGTRCWMPAEDPERPSGETRRWSMREALNAALHQGMDARPSTVVLGEDVALVGGQFRVTKGLLERHGEGRVIDTPLCELGIIGTAVGMAAAGARPVTEIMYAGFINTALDQIFGHVARWRFRYQGRRSMPMVIRIGYGCGVGGAEFHIDAPEALLLQTPGLVIVMPSTPYEAKGLMAAALQSEDPVIFLESLLMYESLKEDVPVEHYTLPIGKARVRREGTDVTLVTYGNLVNTALQAVEQQGASVEVIDLRTLKPWDEATVIRSVEKTGRLVVAHESPRSAGVGADIVSVAARKCLYSLKSAPVIISGLDAPRPTRKLERLANITKRQLLGAIEQALTG